MKGIIRKPNVLYNNNEKVTMHNRYRMKIDRDLKI